MQGDAAGMRAVCRFVGVPVHTYIIGECAAHNKPYYPIMPL